MTFSGNSGPFTLEAKGALMIVAWARMAARKSASPALGQIDGHPREEEKIAYRKIAGRSRDNGSRPSRMLVIHELRRWDFGSEWQENSRENVDAPAYCPLTESHAESIAPSEAGASKAGALRSWSLATSEIAQRG